MQIMTRQSLFLYLLALAPFVLGYRLAYPHISLLEEFLVVDMVHLDFMNFAIFNVADSYLTVGVIILFITLWKEEENGINH